MKFILNFIAAIFIGCVRVYQVVLSPLSRGCCRFTPTCSNYCIEAIKIHGPFYGIWLTFKRILRCRPYGPSGYDPVPPRKQKISKEKV